MEGPWARTERLSDPPELLDREPSAVAAALRGLLPLEGLPAGRPPQRAVRGLHQQEDVLPVEAVEFPVHNILHNELVLGVGQHEDDLDLVQNGPAKQLRRMGGRERREATLHSRLVISVAQEDRGRQLAGGLRSATRGELARERDRRGRRARLLHGDCEGGHLPLAQRQAADLLARDAAHRQRGVPALREGVRAALSLEEGPSEALPRAVDVDRHLAVLVRSDCHVRKEVVLLPAWRARREATSGLFFPPQDSDCRKQALTLVQIL